MRVIGYDASTDGVAFAMLDVGTPNAERLYVAKGQISSDEILTQLSAQKGERGYRVLVAIERPSGIHIPPPRPAPPGVMLKDYATKLMMARSSGTALMATSYVCGVIAASARSLGLRSVELTPQQWRSELGAARSTRDTNQDAMVKSAIETLVTGWPKVSNTHVRDAAGVALAAWWRVNAERKASDVGPEVFGGG